MSRPVELVERGSPYRHQLDVWSSDSDVQFQVDAGPEGMVISDQGVLSWEVPEAASLKTHQVIVHVSNAAGVDAFQAFELTVVAECESTPAVERLP